MFLSILILMGFSTIAAADKSVGGKHILLSAVWFEYTISILNNKTVSQGVQAAAPFLTAEELMGIKRTIKKYKIGDLPIQFVRSKSGAKYKIGDRVIGFDTKTGQIDLFTRGKKYKFKAGAPLDIQIEKMIAKKMKKSAFFKIIPEAQASPLIWLARAIATQIAGYLGHEAQGGYGSIPKDETQHFIKGVISRLKIKLKSKDSNGCLFGFQLFGKSHSAKVGNPCESSNLSGRLQRELNSVYLTRGYPGNPSEDKVRGAIRKAIGSGAN